MPRVLITIPVYNQQGEIGALLDRFPADLKSDLLVVDDASSDDTPRILARAGVHTVRHPQRKGCGPSVRTGLRHGLSAGYDIVVVMAGNGKDDPLEIPRLLEPILKGEADLVQGSRFLPGGRSERIPLHRGLLIRLYSLLFSVLVGRRISDGTNGFRAVARKVLESPEIQLDQDWLQNYEVETYLFFKAVQGHRVMEVPVSKIYPQDRHLGYTKARPIVDWWSHFRPALLLRLGLRH